MASDLLCDVYLGGCWCLLLVRCVDLLLLDFLLTVWV